MRISDWSSDVCSSDLRLPLGADRQPVDLVAVPAHQSRVEPLPVGFQMRGDRPIFLGLEPLDLALALDDQDRKSVVSGKSGSVRLVLGGRVISKKIKS